MLGGVQAVTWTDVKQMAVIVAACGRGGDLLDLGLPHDVGVLDAAAPGGLDRPAPGTRLPVHAEARPTRSGPAWWAGCS